MVTEIFHVYHFMKDRTLSRIFSKIKTAAARPEPQVGKKEKAINWRRGIAIKIGPVFIFEDVNRPKRNDGKDLSEV